MAAFYWCSAKLGLPERRFPTRHSSRDTENDLAVGRDSDAFNTQKEYQKHFGDTDDGEPDFDGF